MNYVIFSSYGNDSIALIQLAYEKKLKDVHILYTDTGWSVDWWNKRVEKAEKWAQSLGFKTHIAHSIGMEKLVEIKKAWPRGGGGKYQFCTETLKKEPAIKWLDLHDPNKETTCMTGVRREESLNRINAPEWVTESDEHGGRELWQPLVRHDKKMRDELVLKSPFDVLPYRSKECTPCVNATKQELKMLDDISIKKVHLIEVSSGVNSKGNPRVMFSPKRHNNAIGIYAVVEDAKHNSDELFEVKTCEGGWCGG